MDILRLSTALIIFAELAASRALYLDGSSGPLRRGSTLSTRARAKTGVTAGKRRRISTIVVVIIVIIVLAAIIALGTLLYCCYRKRQRTKKDKVGHNMDTMSPRPAAAGTGQGDWWQPEDSRNNTVMSQSNLRPESRDAPYSLGGQGYTYGTTVDQHTSRLSAHSPVLAAPSQADHRTSVINAGSSVTHTSGEGLDEPFQIPIGPGFRSRPAPSISPSYHTMATGGETSIEAGGLNTRSPLSHPPAPPSSFQHGTNLEYLQPQSTGTSIYTNPYETTAMTRSTAGHPGGH